MRGGENVIENCEHVIKESLSQKIKDLRSVSKGLSRAEILCGASSISIQSCNFSLLNLFLHLDES